MPNTKISALAEITLATPGDEFVFVDNPSGTPVNRKMTFQNLHTIPDAMSLLFGDSDDAGMRWSTGDADNHALVIGVGQGNQILHITEQDDIALDWNVSANVADTEVWIHSSTTPATDYLRLGAHDGTTALIDVVGGTTLAVKIAGTTQMSVAASALTGNVVGTGSSQVAAGDHSHAATGFTMHVIPAPQSVGSSDYVLFVPLFKDTTGAPDRCVLVTILTPSTVALVEFKRLGDAWVFDPADCANDVSVTLNFTAANQAFLSAFGIDSPVASGNRIVFIAGNNDDTTDTFEMDSIVLTPGGSSLTATAVVIAGANQPTDTNFMSTCGIPLSTTRCMTFFQDDAHFADITESGGTYTFTYDDAKVLAVDTSIDVTTGEGRGYSGIVIGSQVILLRNASTNPVASVMWEMSTSAVLTEEFNPFKAGLMGSDQGAQDKAAIAITGIGGAFAIASPIGGDGGSGQFAGYLVATFPLDSI